MSKEILVGHWGYFYKTGNILEWASMLAEQVHDFRKLL